MSSVAVIVLLLNDLHELLEVGVLKVLVLPLVGRGLVQVSLADVLHNLDARLETSNGLFVVVTEAKLILVLLDPLEALELELSALKVELEIINFLVEFPEPEIDLGCGAEVDGPLEEAVGKSNVDSVGPLSLLELALQALELQILLLDKFEVDGRSFMLAHLGDQFLVVQEEELHVDSLALFVSQERDKGFEHL